MSATRGTVGDREDTIRVLHVDDDSAFADVTETFIEREDDQITVEVETSASEGLDRLTEEQIDCIVSDYNMPGMNGIEFLQAVRDDYPTLPFILFTGKGSEAIASEAISAGVSDYLQKGSGSEQYELLCNRIENLVEKHRAKKNYRELFESVHVGLTIHDPETGVITKVNPAFEDFTGYDQDELVGTHPGNLSPEGSPFTREKANDLIQKTLEEGPQTFEWQDRTTTGGDQWVEVNLKETTIDGQQRILAIVQDITERKEREQKLATTKQKFETVFENSNDALVIIDVEADEFLDCNPAAADLVGYSREELLSMSPSDLHPHNLQKFSEFAETALEEGYGWIDELTCYAKDDTVIPAEVSAATCEIDGRTYLINSIRDISERKARERELEETVSRLQTVIETVPSAVFLADRDDQIALMSEFGKELLGLEDETVEGRKVNEVGSDVLPSKTIEQIEQMHQKTIKTEQQIEKQLELPTPDGPRTVQAITAPYYAGMDEPAGICGVAVDITKQKSRERELAAMNERLEEFASVVSHDLRSPLRIANGQLELAREECESEYLDAVADAHDRMNTLIDDLLTLARNGEQVGELQPVAFAEICETCWSTIETAGATLVIESERRVQADRGRLKQLFKNLFKNAVEHGGEDVTVTVGEIDDGFYIEDDGSGLPDNERNQLFESGYSTTKDGNGLGLSIVKKIVDAHGWEIHVTDSSDGGARFEVTNVDSGVT
jgi:PAS domain S-box-containing protein